MGWIVFEIDPWNVHFKKIHNRQSVSPSKKLSARPWISIGIHILWGCWSVQKLL